MNPNVFKCKLLKCGRDTYDWKEYSAECLCYIAPASVSIREQQTNLLVADLPYSAINGVDVLKEDLFRFNCPNSDKISLKIADASEKNKMICALTGFKVVVDRNPQLTMENKLPNLQHPVVQQFIVKTLFSDGFTDFVDEMEDLLDSINDKTSKRKRKDSRKSD